MKALTVILTVVAAVIAWRWTDHLWSDRSSAMMITGGVLGGLAVLAGVVAGGLVIALVVAKLRMREPRHTSDPGPALPGSAPLVIPANWRPGQPALPAPPSGGRIKTLPAALTAPIDRTD